MFEKELQKYFCRLLLRVFHKNKYFEHYLNSGSPEGLNVKFCMKAAVLSVSYNNKQSTSWDLAQGHNENMPEQMAPEQP